MKVDSLNTPVSNRKRSPGAREPLHILYLINDLGCGGAQQVIFNLVTELDPVRFNPIVGLWGSRWGDEMIQTFIANGIEVIDFQAQSRFDFRAFTKLSKYLSVQKIDILHTNLFLMHIIGRLAGRLASTPRIISTHHNLSQANNPVLRILERITAPLSHSITCVSYAAQKTYFSESEPFSINAYCAGRNKFTIFNSVNLQRIDDTISKVDVIQQRRELGLDDEFVFACIGRLHSSKGHQYLLDAVSRLKELYSSFRVLIVGDGPLSDELNHKTAEKDLCDKITFLGYSDDVYQILAVSNALVQPSIFEGFGLASVEGMACSLPVVSTNLASIAEVVVHEKTGLLVPPHDSVELAKAMAILIERQDLVARYGANGRKRAEETFSSSVSVKQYEALYEIVSGRLESKELAT